MRAMVQDRDRRPAPPMTPVEGRPIIEFPDRWWLLHTRARNEKALAWDLFRLNLTYFLPLILAHRNYGGRRVEVSIPLFPGYVFLSCESRDDRYRALATHRIAQAIEVFDQERFKKELNQVHQALRSRHPVDLYPGIKRGRRCRILAGTLKGIEGVVSNMKKDTSRIYLDVTLLGQSAVIEIDAHLLEAID